MRARTKGGEYKSGQIAIKRSGPHVTVTVSPDWVGDVLQLILAGEG